MLDYLKGVAKETVDMYHNHRSQLKVIAFIIFLLIIVIAQAISNGLHFFIGGVILYFATDNIVDCMVPYLESKVNEKETEKKE